MPNESRRGMDWCFSILVGSSLWCNAWQTGTSARAWQVSVSSSDRASGATLGGQVIGVVKHSVSVSSSDRASGATRCAFWRQEKGSRFQYPRRIEPLVQPAAWSLDGEGWLCFSILVGSSLWCNRTLSSPCSTLPLVSVSSSDRASGATQLPR